ncbi:MAG: glycosyltransferase family 2 protein [Bacteroidota bacterium]|nr:glycosyltransferase family 2 protein [Bacteroidota bacterium]
MKLAVVIPALNEEKSIEGIINRCLNAIPNIIKATSVNSVEITVVSDGSTDNTVSLASKYTDKIKLIIFEINRGYGAAIKEGWENSDADLLGFLDADGTCEPNFFADLCNMLIDENADIALGSRLNPNSQMPLIRKIGNKFYSTILSMVSFQKIKDTASGMRVVKRSSLHRIMPLPDGLHFTPAMSARAILSQDLKIVEKDMTYHEREGESKLKVFRDGIRFLGIILKNIILYQPYKILTFFAVLGLLFCLAIMFYPITFYVKNNIVEEWMIYRFILSEVVGTVSMLLLSAANLSKKILSITLSKNTSIKDFSLLNLFKPVPSIIIIIISLVAGTALIYDSFVQRLTTNVTYEHWSRFVVMSFCYSTSFIFITNLILDHILNLINERLVYLKSKNIFL